MVERATKKWVLWQGENIFNPGEYSDLRVCPAEEWNRYTEAVERNGQLHKFRFVAESDNLAELNRFADLGNFAED